MIEIITKINSAVNNFVWGPVMLLLLVGTGVYLTARTGCIQAAKFGYIMRNTVGSLFRRREKRDKDAKNLTPFQAVTTALAGTVGTGNIRRVSPGLSSPEGRGRCSGCGSRLSLGCSPNLRRSYWP